MLLHRARFAGALTAARLLDENVDDVKSAFDIMDEPQPIKGPALTGYYQRVRAQLNGPRKKVERNTYLVLNSDESIDLLLHATNVLHIEPDNTVTISFGDDDYKTVTTVGRMNQFLPSGFAISRRYKRGGPGGGTDRRYGTTDEWYTSAAADETTFWQVSGMQQHPGYQIVQEAETGDLIRPDGTLIAGKPPTYKKLRSAKPTYSPPADDAPVA